LEGKEVQGLGKREIVKDLEFLKEKEKMKEVKTKKKSEISEMKAKTEK